MGAASVNPDDPELLAASREVNGHAITLNLLGHFLARAHHGDVCRRDLVEFNKADAALQSGYAFSMLDCYRRWFQNGGDIGNRQLAALRILGLFSGPAEDELLNALRQKPAIQNLTEAIIGLPDDDWNLALSSLAECDLVFAQFHTAGSTNAAQQSVDVHPLVREYFAEQVRIGNPEA